MSAHGMSARVRDNEKHALCAFLRSRDEDRCGDADNRSNTMFISLRVLLFVALALAAMGLAASGGGRVLASLHVRAACTTQTVSGQILASCHRGWWKPAPNLQSIGCVGVGVNVWSCPAGVKP